MTQSTSQNRKFVLAKRPKGEPDDTTLRLETEDVALPGKGQMLLRNEYLSLDPYMRGRMSDAPSYAAPVEIGAVMVGGTVAQVVSSDVEGFAQDDWVQAFGGWQDYALSDGAGVINMGKSPENPSWALGVLGMPGLSEDANSIKLIETFASTDRPIGAVCHAPAAFKHPKGADGKPLVSGKTVTGFTNTEEEGVDLTEAVRFLIEDMLKANGGKYEKGADWSSFVVVDGKLVTGQNPASSEEVARKLLDLLRIG